MENKKKSTKSLGGSTCFQGQGDQMHRRSAVVNPSCGGKTRQNNELLLARAKERAGQEVTWRIRAECFTEPKLCAFKWIFRYGDR